MKTNLFLDPKTARLAVVESKVPGEVMYTSGGFSGLQVWTLDQDNLGPFYLTGTARNKTRQGWMDEGRFRRRFCVPVEGEVVQAYVDAARVREWSTVEEYQGNLEKTRAAREDLLDWILERCK